jgi:hypothetical protein
MPPEAHVCLQRRKPMWNGLYYNIRPFVPRRLQIALRRAVMQRKLHKVRGCWPIESKAAEKPPGFQGWPDGKQFCLVLTHDVESRIGYDRCRELALLEKRLGFRSAFNFVARKYPVSSELRGWLVQEGFEVGVHGLYHDGKLYASRKIFQERAKGINEILHEWGAVGFRSPAMHYKADWLHDLDIEYDCSTFDTDPFEPEGSAYHSIFPHIVTHSDGVRSYVELPYTLPQDFTLFIMLQFQDISIWRQKLDWIAHHGGMALVLTHPDYMHMDNKGRSYEEYSTEYYEALLNYIHTHHAGRFWPALPREVSAYWRQVCND